MKRVPVIIQLLLFAALLLTGCEDHPGGRVKPPTEIKLGVIGPFSGVHQEWGESGLLGVKAVIDHHEKANGQLKVQLFTEDDQSDPTLAVAALAKLAFQDEVDAVVVLSGSQTMLAVTDAADRYKIPIVSTLSSHPDVSKSGWVSQIIFDDKAQATVAALFVMDELLIDRASVVWDGEDPHSRELADNFRRVYQEAGGTVSSIDISSRQDDYQNILNQLQKNEVPFVYLPVTVDHLVQFELGARVLGYNPQAMVSDGVLSQMMLEYGDNLELLEGMLATDMYTTEVEMSDFGKAVKSNLPRLSKSPATTLTALGCEGTQVILSAIAKCGRTPQNECINRMIRSGNEFEGVLDPFIIDLDGKAQRRVYINKIKNQRLRFLLKVN